MKNIMFIPSNDRGQADHGWLKAKHSFSFAQYFNPDRMGYGDLRVINQDEIAPSRGFGTHPHHDMEIITFVTHGVLAHKDTLGNQSQILPGEIQVMSAGSGIAHSEFNASNSEACKLLQIWVQAKQKSVEPRYDQVNYLENKDDTLIKLVSDIDGDGLVGIHQNIDLYLASFHKDKEVKLSHNGRYWIQVLNGSLSVNGQELNTGDGLGFEDSAVSIESSDQAKTLVFLLQ